MTIGERVLALIKDRGMTQIEFCKRTGIPQSTVSSWRLKNVNPSVDKVGLICDVLQVDPKYLLSGEENEWDSNRECLEVYHGDSDFEVVVEYRKLKREYQDRILSYVKALAADEEETTDEPSFK